jgi:hypothetical protein
MIKKEQVEELNQRFMTEKGMTESIDVFKSNEPYVYSWMTTHAKAMISAMSKKKAIDPAVLTDVFENICKSYVFTYFLMSRNRDMLVDKLMIGDQFQAFLEGKLDDKYYRYDTMGMAPESDLVTAKHAHFRNELQTLRKRLIPLIAEDVGMGAAPQEALEKVEGLSCGKA